MYGCRSLPKLFIELKSISTADHDVLRKRGAEVGKSLWDDEMKKKKKKEENKEENEEEEAKKKERTLIKAFKSEVKGHYWTEQNNRCCYCSKELDKSKNSYDAEHIIDKHYYPQLMFEFNNLAAACKTCNRKKSDSEILVKADRTIKFAPEKSADYLIVHPLLDEWKEFFEYDEIWRILPVAGKAKALKTIELCGINFLNAARLAGCFTEDKAKAEKALEQYYSLESLEEKRAQLDILRALAEEFDLASAKVIVECLESDYSADVKSYEESGVVGAVGD